MFRDEVPLLQEALTAHGPEEQIAATVEALLPQYEDRLRLFYRDNPPTVFPLNVNCWLFSELIYRFGPPEVLGRASAIARRMDAVHDPIRLAVAA